MHLLRYMFTALLMYRSPREGRAEATCCGCGEGPVQVLLWGPDDWASRHETYCTACATDRWRGWLNTGCTSSPLPTEALTNAQVDAASLAAWLNRTALPVWLAAP